MKGLRYTPRLSEQRPRRYLVAIDEAGQAERFPFDESIEIGRDEAHRPDDPGVLLVADAAVSFHHCILTCRADGRCFVRDLSRNGTRLNGRRLLPNVETEVTLGETIEITRGHRFVVTGEQSRTSTATACEGRTMVTPDFAIATVLVGDIRDYTGLVRRAPAAELQQSVGRVFGLLAREVEEYGGTIKEYQGDAIFAYWEGNPNGDQAVAACRAALALDRTVARLAADRSVWQLPDFPLGMDWALATGSVVIDAVGIPQRAGLSMIGEPVVLAFRLEKLATAETGRILACQVTRNLAAGAFTFRDLGCMSAKGFEAPARVFALVTESAQTI